MKLKYIGFRARGNQRFPNGGELYVEKGEVYDIPDEFAENLINTMCWEKVSIVKKKVEKKKAIFIDEDKDEDIQSGRGD